MRSVFIYMTVGVLSLTAATTKSAKIAVMVFPGPSHFFMMETIGQQLEDRGHEVTYLMCSMLSFSKKTKVKKLLYHTPQYPVDHFLQRTVGQIVKHRGKTFPLGLLYEAIVLIKDMCDALLGNEEVLAQLKGYDLVLADNGMMGCGNLVKEKVGIPTIVDFSAWGLNDLYNWHYGLPWPLSYIPADPIDNTDEGIPFFWRCANVLSYVTIKILNKVMNVVGVPALKDKYGIAPEKSFTQLVAKTDLVLVPLDWAIEWSRPVPPNVKVIGPTAPKPAKKLSQEFEDFMQSAGKEGVILVSFGSMASTLDDRRADLLAKAFSMLKCKVLWKYNKLFPDVKNLKTVEWMPQNDILGHPQLKLFMTHGGSNSIHEAAYHGVPMLVTPLYGDQHGFARKIEVGGFGESVDIRTEAIFTAESIAELINKLIDNPKYKANAVKVSRLLKDRPRTPAEEGADWIEYVIRHHGTRHLRPYSTELPFYQYFLLDVMLFLVFVTVVVLCIICKTCKFIKHLCCSTRLKEKVQ